jgi:hypothetical protein
MPMERRPYQEPQTSMERHVAELVEHLRNGTDNRAGFAEKVEAALRHAFWLEKLCAEQRLEIDNLYKNVLPGMPHIKAMAERFDTRDPDPRAGPSPMAGCLSFDWVMEAIRWRGVWNGFDVKDAETERKVRARTYRQLMRLVRKEFERTFKINMDRLRAVS